MVSFVSVPNGDELEIFAHVLASHADVERLRGRLHTYLQKFVLVTEIFLSQDRPSFLDLAVRSQFCERYCGEISKTGPAQALYRDLMKKEPLAGGFVQHRLDFLKKMCD